MIEVSKKNEVAFNFNIVSDYQIILKVTDTEKPIGLTFSNTNTKVLILETPNRRLEKHGLSEMDQILVDILASVIQNEYHSSKVTNPRAYGDFIAELKSKSGEKINSSDFEEVSKALCPFLKREILGIRLNHLKGVHMDEEDDSTTLLDNTFVNVLGTVYELKIGDRDNLKDLEDGFDGLCNFVKKEILLTPDFDYEDQAHERMKQVLVHEMLHAFLFESGHTQYADDERLIEALTTLIPKLVREHSNHLQTLETYFRGGSVNP